jgi:hypothetical protein
VSMKNKALCHECRQSHLSMIAWRHSSKCHRISRQMPSYAPMSVA